MRGTITITVKMHNLLFMCRNGKRRDRLWKKLFGITDMKKIGFGRFLSETGVLRLWPMAALTGRFCRSMRNLCGAVDSCRKNIAAVRKFWQRFAAFFLQSASKKRLLCVKSTFCVIRLWCATIRPLVKLKSVLMRPAIPIIRSHWILIELWWKHLIKRQILDFKVKPLFRRHRMRWCIV